MKKKIKKMLILFDVFLFVLIAMVSVVQASNKKKVSIQAQNKIVYLGQRNIPLKIRVSKGATVSFHSSKPSVVVVSSKGKISAKKVGRAYITITAKENTTYRKTVKKIRIDVKKRKNKITYIGVTEMKVGDVEVFYAKSKIPIGCEIKCKSLTPKILRINQDESLEALRPGKAKLMLFTEETERYTSAKKIVTIVIKEREKRFITLHGVEFDMMYFPKERNVSDSMECLSVIPQSEINPKDITYKIADGKSQLLCDYNTPKLLGLKHKKYLHDYYVSDWNHMVAYVETCYNPEMYLKYRVEIYNALETGSFDVSVYYKGLLLKTCKVNVKTKDQRLVKYRLWMNDLERKAWTNQMDIKEKLTAIEKYIYDNYSYTTDGFWCNDGASALLYAARDLGLNARYRFVGLSYDYYDKCYDEYFHMGSAYMAGHVCTVVTIEGKDYIYETQGHPG